MTNCDDVMIIYASYTNVKALSINFYLTTLPVQFVEINLPHY